MTVGARYNQRGTKTIWALRLQYWSEAMGSQAAVLVRSYGLSDCSIGQKLLQGPWKSAHAAHHADTKSFRSLSRALAQQHGVHSYSYCKYHIIIRKKQCFESGSFCPDPNRTFYPESGSGSGQNTDPDRWNKWSKIIVTGTKKVIFNIHNFGLSCFPFSYFGQAFP